MKNLLKLVVALGICFCAVPQVFAQAVSIDPVHVIMTDAKPVGVVTVSRPADSAGKPQIFQVIAVKWNDLDNPSDIGPTKALVVQPKVFKLAAGKSQVIRVAPKDKRIINSGQNFRVLVRALGDQSSNPNSVTLNMVHSLPVKFNPQPKQ